MSHRLLGAYNALVFAERPTPTESAILNCFWAKQDQPLSDTEIAAALTLRRHRVGATVVSLRKKLRPEWRIALLPRKRYILLRSDQEYVPEYEDEVLTPKLYERYLEIKLNPGVTQRQLAQRFGIKENLVRISVFLMNQKLEPYGLRIYSRHHGYRIKTLT